jgi:hypothetical protein
MDPKVEKIGKAFIVDPNPPGTSIIPPEDLFIYVKFSAYPRSRVTYGGQNKNFNSGIEDEVHFISTNLKYNNTTGKLDPELQKSYATTDWSNIGGFKDKNGRSAGALEGFGIKSIDIKYNSSLVPTVDITFTDVRGGALFDVIKDDERLSPYSIFFKMPYPVFNLSIKGYFGQKVDFCLHMTNWTSNFDGSTGNFEISANFLGFQQAFLNDMVLGNIIGVVNTPEGYNKLNEIYEDSKSEITSPNLKGKTLDDLRKTGDLDIRKIDDFFTQISKLQVESEIIKTDLNSFQLLKDLNGKLTLLKTIRSFIGAPLDKHTEEAGEGSTQINQGLTKSYLELENNKDIIRTTSINDDEIIINKNCLSIRDYIVFNSINTASFKTYISTLNTIILAYQEYLKSDTRVKFTPDNTLESAKALSILKTEKVKNFNDSLKDDNLINSFTENGSDDNSWENYIVSPTKNNKLKPESKVLSEVLQDFFRKDSIIYLKKPSYTNGPQININFNITEFIRQFNGKGFYSPTLLPTTNVFVADFRKQRALVEDSIIDIESIIKIQKEIVQLELNEKLLKNFRDSLNVQFNPTIGKCFEIIANNTQAMVETVYDISVSAEDKSKSKNRKSILPTATYETDVPTGIDSVAWPSIYRKNGKGDLEEIYIGEVSSINRSDFPELDFVERVFENLVGKTKTLEDVTKASLLKSGLDTDNWFPINPIDYKINPWIKLNRTNDVQSMGNELIEKFFTRLALLINYSRFSPSTGLKDVDGYARLEAIAANKTIFAEKPRLIISNILIDIENQLNNPNTPVVDSEKFNLRKSKFYKDFILEENKIFIISEENKFQKIGDFPISGTFSDKVEYILFDEPGVLNNTKKLITEISEDESYRKLIDSKSSPIVRELKGPSLFYKNFYTSSKNLTTYNSFNVWYDTICTNILKASDNNILGNLGKCKLENINPSGTTYNSTYLNMTYFKKASTGKTDYEDVMTYSDLYDTQPSNYSRALLLLSTFPFKNFKEGFIQSVFESTVKDGARIINLPKFYVYYIGALLWRYEESITNTDPLKFPTVSGKNYSLFSTPSNCYLNKIGYKLIKPLDKIKNELLEDELIYLPKSVKNTFIKKFKNWVDNGNFNSAKNGNFERNMKLYVPDIDTEPTLSKKEREISENKIYQDIIETTDLILLNPDIFDKTKIDQNKKNKGLVVDKAIFLNYVTNFRNKFNDVGKKNDNGIKSTKEIENDNKTTNIVKLGLYNYFKNISNKWIGNDGSFSICGDSADKNLFEYFKFIDRGWRFIGDEATFNLKSFLTLGSNLDTSVYFFISKLLRDSNFLFQILPTYINFKNAKEVAKIFQPQTVLETNESSGPIFCCIHVGGASQSLDIGERGNYYFKDDGFSLTTGNLPTDLLDPNSPSTSDTIDKNGNINLDESSLVAFRVSFGAQNQTVFKNVSLNQQEHRETGEYFKALSDLIDKRGGTQKTYVGTDLLRLFKTRSYTCKVEAMGCMNIQPLMYFDLQNVPFFNGAYLITSVSHNISPNQMSTSFEGVRQSRYITSPANQITADLDVDLNESSETPKIEFRNINSKDSLLTIGVLNPKDAFDFENNLSNNATSIDKFRRIGVTQFTDEVLGSLLEDTKILLIKASATTNSQVTMFLSSTLANSNNLLNKDMEWDVQNKEPMRFPDSDLLNKGKVIYYGNTSTPSKYLLSLPIFTGGTLNDISYRIQGNDLLKEFNKNDEIEIRKKEINESLSKLDINTLTGKLEKEKLEKELSEVLKTESNLINDLEYYNIFEGDAYRYKPRGYLYVIGRKQYTDILKDVGQTKPDVASNTEVEAMGTSIKVWKYLKDVQNKSAYDYSSSDTGAATVYSRCIQISQRFSPKSNVIENAFITFEKVLTNLTQKNGEPLINYFNPGP